MGPYGFFKPVDSSSPSRAHLLRKQCLRLLQFFNTRKLQNHQDQHLISKISTRSSITLKMTYGTPENPIQIRTTLCLENYKENYPIWEREIFEILRGHGLLDFFYGTNLPSIPTDGTISVEFECWQKKDQVIWNWLFSTLAPDIQSNLGQLAHATTHLLWKSLRSMYITNPLPIEFNLEDLVFIAKTSTRSSGTPENPTNPQISSTSEIPLQINHQISIPLNEKNYQENFPHWESEVLRVLAALGLQDYLDSTISQGEKWKQDKLIRNWLRSSLHPFIVCELKYQPCATAPMWKRLRFMHTTNYFPTVRKLKLQLQTIKKSNATCAEYLQQFNLIIGQLIRVGCFLDDQQLVPYVLQGLGQEFEPFVNAAIMTLTSQTLTMTNLYRLLFEEEKCLKCLFSLPQPLIVHNPGTASSNDIYFIGQNSSLFANPAQYAPHSQPRIDQLSDLSYQEVPSSSQQVFPILTPSEVEFLNDLLSPSPDKSTDQSHVENGAQDRATLQTLLHGTTHNGLSEHLSADF